MVRFYADAYREIEAEVARVAKEMHARLAAGEDVEYLVRRSAALTALERQVESRIAEFADRAGHYIQAQQKSLVRRAVEHARQLAAAGMGAPPAGQVFEAHWHGVPARAVERLIGALQAGSPLTDLLKSLGPDAGRAVRRELINGLVMGRSTRQVAVRIRGALNGSAVRALTIARTETFRAYREGALLAYRQNPEVVKGWQWMSALNARCCAMCVAMHGTLHQLNEHMGTHPNCRCTMVPVTVSWQALLGEQGAGLPDTRPPKMVQGEQWFAGQGEEIQKAILGHAAFNAYKAGAIQLADLVGFGVHERWGPVRYTRSLSRVLGSGASAYYKHPPKGGKGGAGGGGQGAGGLAAPSFKVFANGEEGDRWARLIFMEWAGRLTADEKRAIRDYQGTTYRWLNARLRGKPNPYGYAWTRQDDAVKDRYVSRIDAAISRGRTTEDIVTYRGFSDDRITNPVVWDNIVGQEIRDDGYCSTSFAREVAEKFAYGGNPARRVLAEIRIPAGMRAGYVSLVHEMGEKELLLPRGTRFRVIHAEQLPDYKYLILEVIPDGQ
jgi:SPP1 gp7 family putative phage head morphogenesis protein